MYNIGIDLGGTNIAVGLVDNSGKILVKKSMPTKRERPVDEIIKDMANLCLAIIKEGTIEIKDINSIGVGSPGIVDPVNCTIQYSCNIAFDNTSIRAELQKYINKPIFADNDANLAAVGEYEFGAGKEYNDLVAITLGTGLGGGVIINKKLIRGSFNAGAEIGHIVIEIEGEKCTCGRRGCWEQYSSATGLIREARNEVIENPESLIYKIADYDINNISAKTVFDAYEKNDKSANKILDRYYKYLSIGLVNIINIFQPEAIIIGGGISAQGDKLIKPLEERMEKEIYGGKKAFLTKIIPASLGNDAGIIGAAMLYKYQ